MPRRSQCNTLKNWKLLFFLFWFLAEFSVGQDIAFTQFYVNPSLLNPSFTGSEGRPVLFLSYRKQWLGIDGGPSIMNLNVQTSLANQLNLGVNVSNQQVGLVTNSGIQLTGAYTLHLAAENFVRFGMSLGGTFSKVDLAALNFGSAPGNSASDPLLANLADNSFQPTGNLGVTYHTKSLHVGIALPSLFQPVYLTPNAFNANFKPFDNMVIHASNRFYLEKGKNVFEPYVIYRLNNGLPGQFEVAALFHYQHVGWIGASFRQDYGISGLLGIKMNKLLALGYSYSLPTSGVNEIGRATHEVHLAYLFGKHKKEVVQLYSFVDTEKLRKKPREAQLVVKKTDTKPAAKPVPAKVAPKKEEPVPVVVAPVLDAQHHEEQEKISRLEVHAADPHEEHDETHHPHAERHDFVKRGGHHEEVEFGNHIVVGVFRSQANAKHFSDGLKNLGFTDIDYGFLTANNLWYVHFAASEDINEARATRDELRSKKIFRDGWLLTVHE